VDGDVEPRSGAVPQCVERVDEQVHPHLVELRPASLDRLEMLGAEDPLAGEVAGEQAKHPPQGFLDVDQLPLAAFCAGEQAKIVELVRLTQGRGLLTDWSLVRVRPGELESQGIF